MRKFIFLLSLLITGLFCKSQEIQTLWLDKNHNPTSESRAVWKNVLILNDSTLTMRLSQYKSKNEIVEHYKNGKPVGKWQELYKGKVLVERNFDSIEYLSDGYLEMIRNSLGIVADNKDTIAIDSAVEIPPSYPGGDIERIKFLQKNIIYPHIARDFEFQGTTFLAITIGRSGEIESVKVAKSSNPYLDYEAVRVVKKMPKWSPATQNGRPVSVLFHMPVKFTLIG